MGLAPPSRMSRALFGGLKPTLHYFGTQTSAGIKYAVPGIQRYIFQILMVNAMKVPNILLLTDLLKPINDVFVIIEKSHKQLNLASSEIVEKSIFSYVVSLFEILQTEILTIFLDAFPEKIKKSEFQINKDELSNDLFQIKKEAIEKYIQNLSYNTIYEYMKMFFELLSIKSINNEATDKFVEIKETRNLLLHNNLKMNSTYQRKAGAKKREAEYDEYLSLRKDYILKSIDTIKTVISHIECELKTKYAKYDKHYVLKSLWEYLFKSPILKYDDFWQNDSGFFTFKKSVREFKKLIRDSFSSSETLLLFLWINHFNASLCDRCFEPRFLNTFSLDVNTRNKYMYLNGIIINYPDLFKT